MGATVPVIGLCVALTIQTVQSSGIHCRIVRFAVATLSVVGGRSDRESSTRGYRVHLTLFDLVDPAFMLLHVILQLAIQKHDKT
jgi:hypothetical protein